LSGGTELQAQKKQWDLLGCKRRNRERGRVVSAKLFKKESVIGKNENSKEQRKTDAWTSVRFPKSAGPEKETSKHAGCRDEKKKLKGL